MNTPQPVFHKNLIANHPAVGAGGVSIKKPDGQAFGMGKPVTYQGSYSTCRMPDSRTGVSLLEATYPGVMDRPEGERMKNFAEAVLEADKCYIQIEVRKYRTGSFNSRFVASLSLMWGGICQAPNRAKGSWYLGSAGADEQAGMWKQISKAVSDYEPLPYKGTRGAIAGGISSL